MEKFYISLKAVFGNIFKCFATLFFASLCFAQVGYSAENLKPKTYKVGFWYLPGYNEQNALGERSGYSYEYLEKIAACMGWSLEYVGYDKSWSELLNMLENGEIDIMSNATKNPEREKRFDYSDRPIGLSFTVLTVKAGDNRFKLNDYANWNGMRVGMIRESSRNAQFERFAAEKNFKFKPFIFSTYIELEKALQEGKIDALISTNTRRTKNEWVLEKINPAPIYFIVHKGDKKLLKELNQALSLLEINAPRLNETLVQRYYSEEVSKSIQLSADEIAFIEKSKKQGRKFRALIKPDRIPMADFSDGKMRGIFKDVADLIAKISGLDIEIVPTATRAEYLQHLQNGDFDLVMDAWRNFSYAEKFDLYLTEPYLTSSVLLLQLKNPDAITGRNAILKDSWLIKDLNAKGVDTSKFLFCDNMQDLEEAVLDGKVDGAYMHTRMANEIIYRDKTMQLASRLLYSFRIEYSVGVNRKNPPELIRIMGKAVRGVSVEDVRRITNSYDVLHKSGYSFKKLIQANPVETVSFVTAILAVVFTMLLYVLMSRRKIKAALKRAIMAEKAKSYFLATMSHEIRTPLNAVIGFSELLKGADISEKQAKDYLEDISFAGNALLALINDVLDLSKLEAEQMKFVSVETDFEKLLRDACVVFNPHCKKKNLALLIRTLPMPHVFIDNLRIRQILFNIIGNAVKFTNNGSITVSAKFMPTSAELGELEFSVWDTGIGISDDEKRVLFEPFAQSKMIRGTQTANNGTGLGLAIVRKMVRQMKGDISLESRLGVGSKFTVRLAEIPYMSAKSEKIESVQETFEIGKTDFSKLSILLVDDVLMNLKVLEAICLKLGIGNVKSVTNASDALSELERQNFNAVLTDMWMPKINGMQLAAKIRANAKLAKVSIIAVTADIEAKGNFNFEKFDDVVFKPITLEKMHQIFERLIATSKK